VRAGVAVLVGVLAACSGGDQIATGTVVAVEGDLTTVTSFDVQVEGGGRMTFVPEPGLTRFAADESGEGAHLTHLRDHLRDGHPVMVTYRVEDGVNVAIRVEDSP
jgi:hypothetical protein